MRITVLELAATWADAPRALADVDARLAAGPPTDLVLVPEAALTGYVSPDGDFDLAPFAETLAGPTAQRCAAIARAHQTHLVAPLVLREGAALSNAMICYAPTGAPAFVYRKRHPWYPETWATPGPSAPPRLALAGHVISICICFDIHTVADDARAELTAADVLLFPSAWVEEVDSRPRLLATLARDFGLCVINANWAPGVVRLPGQGGSCIVGPDGGVLARAPLAGRIDLELPASGSRS